MQASENSGVAKGAWVHVPLQKRLEKSNIQHVSLVAPPHRGVLPIDPVGASVPDPSFVPMPLREKSN